MKVKLLISLSDYILVSFSTKGPGRKTIALNRDRTPKQDVLHPCETRIRSERLVHTSENLLPVCSFNQRLQHVAAAASLDEKDALLSSSKLDRGGGGRCGNRDNLIQQWTRSGCTRSAGLVVYSRKVQPSHRVLVVRDSGGKWSGDSVINK